MRLVGGCDSDKIFHFGFASTLMFLIWSIWGGFLDHMLQSNFLAVLVMPQWEAPIKSIQDVVDSGKGIFYVESGEYVRQMFANSDDPNYKILAERWVQPKNYDHWWQLVENIIKDNDNVRIDTELDSDDVGVGNWFEGDIIRCVHHYHYYYHYY